MKTTKVRAMTKYTGYCTRKRAEHLMGAAAAAGGAIYVDCPPVAALYQHLPERARQHAEDTDGAGLYLCCGTVGGEPVAQWPVPANAILDVLDADAARFADVWPERSEELSATARSLRSKIVEWVEAEGIYAVPVPDRVAARQLCREAGLSDLLVYARRY